MLYGNRHEHLDHFSDQYCRDIETTASPRINFKFYVDLIRVQYIKTRFTFSSSNLIL